MFPLKFLPIFLLVALFFPACRFWQTQTDATPTPTPIAVEESKIPFSTKEPEIYQVEIVVTANGVENKMLTARNGANRITIYEYQTALETALLQSNGGSYTIARNQKIYTENQATDGSVEDEIFPVAELLNQKEAAVYEQVSDENDSAIYRVRLNDSKNSEIVITVDKKINLPTKQEFFSVTGEQKTLLMTTELKNFNSQTDAQIFDLPKDYKKVSPTEFQQIVRRAESKTENGRN